MSDFIIFKAAFNGSATPAIGTYTAEGATAQFNVNASLSPDYYLYNTADNTAVQWFVPTAETTDFEFVADILTRQWTNRVTYFIIADSTGTTRLRMWSQYDNWFFENSDSINSSGSEYIGVINPTTSGGFGVFHQFRVRVRKLTESSSSVEVYVDGTLKLTATAGAALITCAKIGFVGGTGTFGSGIDVGVKNAYVYDLSGGDVIDRGVLSGAFTRFIDWAKGIFAQQDNVVPRSGGNVMTGSKLGRPNDTGTLSVSGGTTVSGTTGYVKCYGASASTYPGAVEIGGNNIKFIFRNSAIESWAGNQDLGSSGRQFGTAYIKALNINGTAAGDILTHNAAEFVPVSGGAVMTGNTLARVNDTGSFFIASGTQSTDGGVIALFGKNYNGADAGSITLGCHGSSDKYMTLRPDGTVTWSGTTIRSETDNSCNLGSSDCDFSNVYTKNVKTWRTTDSLQINYGSGACIILRGKQQSGETGLFRIYADDGTNEKYLVGKPDGYLAWNGSPISISSDSRLKSDIESISDEILDAWENLEPKQYKYKSDVETDKDTAQTHYGWIAQDVKNLLKGDRKAEVQNGLFTHDYWDEQNEISHEETYTEEVETKSGEKQTVTKTRKVIDQPYIEKGDSYGLRYTECLVVECKYLRRCIKRLEARLTQLENPEESQEKGADK